MSKSISSIRKDSGSNSRAFSSDNNTEISNLNDLRSNACFSGFGVIIESHIGKSFGKLSSIITIIDFNLNSDISQTNNKCAYVELHISYQQDEKIPCALNVGDIIRFQNFYFKKYEHSNILYGFPSLKCNAGWQLYFYKEGIEYYDMSTQYITQ